MKPAKSKHSLRSKSILVAALGLVGLFSDSPTARAETPIQAWVRRYNGPANDDDRTPVVAVNNTGDVFVSGASKGTNNSFDYTTIKYSSGGVALWTNRYDGPVHGNDHARALGVDGSGNVFVTGLSASSHTYGGSDIATVAYSDSGVLLWSNAFWGGYVAAQDLTVDGNGDVLVSGACEPPGASGSYYKTVKYLNNGVPLWTTFLSSSLNAGGNSVAVNSGGDVFVSGASGTIVYSGSGVPLWTNTGLYGVASELDAAGNLFVTWLNRTIKCNASGMNQWTNNYYDATTLAVDAGGNVIVTGSVGIDYRTIKYSAAGSPIWTNRYNEPSNGEARPTAVAVDAADNVFVTGYARGANTNFDYVTIKYSGKGVPLWTNTYNGPGNGTDQPLTRSCLAIGPDGAAYVTGHSDRGASTSVNYDFATVKYISLPEIASQCGSRTNNATTTAAFVVSATGSAPLRYQWQRSETNLFNGGNVSGVNSNTLTLANVQPEDAGSYRVIVTNAFGSVTSSVAVLTVVVASPITLSSATVSDGVFNFSFTNTPGASFTVLTTTNVGLPLSNWTVLGGLVEISPGQFKFTDPQATTNQQRFYCVRTP